MKKGLITLGAIGILAAGGTVAADKTIDPYTDKGATLEIAKESTVPNAGMVKAELSKAEPAVTLSKWNGETGMTVRYNKVKAAGSRALLTNRMEWKGAKEEVHAYPLDASVGVGEDGGFEIEIVLNEKPDTNVFEFQIDGAEDLDFFYQPELTPEEIAEGAERPENVVGSYAVYHKTKANHRVGGTNYATGKVYHIYRPQITDGDGNNSWGILVYNAGNLTVTIPDEIYNDPKTNWSGFRIDPTFGYTSIGLSTLGSNIFNTRMVVADTSTSEDGTVDSLTFYLTRPGGTQNAKLLLTNSTFNILTNGITPAVSISTSNWYTGTYSTSPTVTGSTVYYFGVIGDGDSSHAIVWFYDDSTGSFHGRDTTNSYTTPSDPTDVSELLPSTALFSAYATYTASGGGGAAAADVGTYTIYDE